LAHALKLELEALLEVLGLARSALDLGAFIRIFLLSLMENGWEGGVLSDEVL